MGSLIEVEKHCLERAASDSKLLANRLRDWSSRYKDGTHNHQMMMRLVDDIESIIEELDYAIRSGERSRAYDALRWLLFKAIPLIALAATAGAAEGLAGSAISSPSDVEALARTVVDDCQAAEVVLDKEEDFDRDVARQIHKLQAGLQYDVREQYEEKIRGVYDSNLQERIDRDRAQLQQLKAIQDERRPRSRPS